MNLLEHSFILLYLLRYTPDELSPFLFSFTGRQFKPTHTRQNNTQRSLILKLSLGYCEIERKLSNYTNFGWIVCSYFQNGYSGSSAVFPCWLYGVRGIVRSELDVCSSLSVYKNTRV